MRAYFGVPPGTKVDLTWHLEGLFQQPASGVPTSSQRCSYRHEANRNDTCAS